MLVGPELPGKVVPGILTVVAGQVGHGFLVVTEAGLGGVEMALTIGVELPTVMVVPGIKEPLLVGPVMVTVVHGTVTMEEGMVDPGIDEPEIVDGGTTEAGTVLVV